MFGGVFSWSNVLYERVYPGGDLLIQFVGRDAYKQFWNFSKDEKENLATQLAIELPALRGKVGASQEEIASAVGISRLLVFHDKLIVPTKIGHAQFHGVYI